MNRKHTIDDLIPCRQLVQKCAYSQNYAFVSEHSACLKHVRDIYARLFASRAASIPANSKVVESDNDPNFAWPLCLDIL